MNTDIPVDTSATSELIAKLMLEKWTMKSCVLEKS